MRRDHLAVLAVAHELQLDVGLAALEERAGVDRLENAARRAAAQPERHAARIEQLWSAGIRTFVSLMEEGERSPARAELAQVGASRPELERRGGVRPS